MCAFKLKLTEAEDGEGYWQRRVWGAGGFGPRAGGVPRSRPLQRKSALGHHEGQSLESGGEVGRPVWSAEGGVLPGARPSLPLHPKQESGRGFWSLSSPEGLGSTGPPLPQGGLDLGPLSGRQGRVTFRKARVSVWLQNQIPAAQLLSAGHLFLTGLEAGHPAGAAGRSASWRGRPGSCGHLPAVSARPFSRGSSLVPLHVRT